MFSSKKGQQKSTVVQTLRQELAYSRKMLQDCADTSMLR